MNCPYCGVDENECVPDVVVRNAQWYGGGLVRFYCCECGEVVEAHAIVKVKVVQAFKTDEDSFWTPRSH